jgi:predicted hydrocarbon binding protein
VHGIILNAFRDFLTAQHGPAVAKSVFGEEPEYLITEAYPDEALTQLFARACEATGEELDPLVGAFGVYTGEQVFPRLYPAFYSAARDTRSFLLNVEERIHELVRATVPNAEPPRLLVKSSEADGVQILYDSPRRLCRLLEGLTVGTARFYGETAAIRETACMKSGAEACCFEVRLARG